MQYLRTLAPVLGSKQLVLSAVENLVEVLTIASFRTEAQDVCTAIGQGETLSHALGKLGLILPVVRQLNSAGEAPVRLARMTEHSAVLVETGLSTEHKRVVALFEPMLIILVRAFVLLIILAVLLPIFDFQVVVTG